MSVSAKYLIESPPKKKMAVSESKMVSDVLIERCIVWFTDALTTSGNVAFRILKRFSRMRSNTTMVSLMEYARTVSTAAMKEAPISICK